MKKNSKIRRARTHGSVYIYKWKTYDFSSRSFTHTFALKRHVSSAGSLFLYTWEIEQKTLFDVQLKIIKRYFHLFLCFEWIRSLLCVLRMDKWLHKKHIPNGGENWIYIYCHYELNNLFINASMRFLFISEVKKLRVELQRTWLNFCNIKEKKISKKWTLFE